MFIFTYFSNVSFSVFFVWKHCKALSTVQLVLKISSGVVPVINIYCVEQLFSSLLSVFTEGMSPKYAYYWSIALAAINLIVFLLNSFNIFLQQKIAYDFESQIKYDLLKKSGNLPYQIFESSTFQNKYSRMMHSHNSMLGTFDSTLLILQTLISLVTITLYLIKLHILFMIIIFVMIIPLIIIEFKYGKIRYQLNVNLSENSRNMNYLENLMVNKSSLKEVRLNYVEDYILDSWKKYFTINARSKNSLEKKQIKVMSLVQIIVSVSIIFSTSLVVYLISMKVIKVAALTAVIQAVQNLQGLIPAFANSLSNSYESSLNVKEFREFMDSLQVKKTIEKRSIKSLETIRVLNLSYTYPNSKNMTLKNINLEIQKGKKIAIMGSNGSGKSTLIKCITGLYETKKSVLINDDLSIEKLSKQSFWGKINVMFQDFNKYELRLRENLTMDFKKFSDENLFEVLDLVGMKTFVKELPEQLNTQVGNLFNEGKELSGGQWQKIALARSILTNPSILFLDEPTSALDPDSEYQIISNVLTKLNETGVVYITHRVNVAKLADHIIYLKNGQIIEEGSHDDLLRQGGEYSQIFNRQLNNLISDKKETIHV